MHMRTLLWISMLSLTIAGASTCFSVQARTQLHSMWNACRSSGIAIVRGTSLGLVLQLAVASLAAQSVEAVSLSDSGHALQRRGDRR